MPSEPPVTIATLPANSVGSTVGTDISCSLE
jgi:hypothetical protein